MKHRLLSIGLAEQTVCLFENPLSGKSQRVQAEGITPLAPASNNLLLILYNAPFTI